MEIEHDQKRKKYTFALKLMFQCEGTLINFNQNC